MNFYEIFQLRFHDLMTNFLFSSSLGGRDGRDRPVWLDKYGPPTRTDYRVIVENLSSRVSWQVTFLLIMLNVN